VKLFHPFNDGLYPEWIERVE